MLQMSTINKQDEPNIQPVWFYYDKNKEKLMVITSKKPRKFKILILTNYFY